MSLLTELVSQLGFELQICRAYGALKVRHRPGHRAGSENGARVVFN
jgi:hypothetical protein